MLAAARRGREFGGALLELLDAGLAEVEVGWRRRSGYRYRGLQGDRNHATHISDTRKSPPPLDDLPDDESAT